MKLTGFVVDGYVSFADIGMGRTDGDVIIYVYEKFKPRKANFLANSNSPCNDVSVALSSLDHPCIITSVNRPPNTNKDDTVLLIDFLTSIADYKYG